MKKKNIYKKLLLLLVLIYGIFTLVNQQKVINQYTDTSKEIASQIEKEKTNNEDLILEKDNVNSKDFIEQTAREKLDMYYPNEKIYIDRGI